VWAAAAVSASVSTAARKLKYSWILARFPLLIRRDDTKLSWMSALPCLQQLKIVKHLEDYLRITRQPSTTVADRSAYAITGTPGIET
jgi:hypothetical protein